MEYTNRDLICLSIDSVDVPETGTVPETVTVPGLTAALELGGSAAARVELLAELEQLRESGILMKEVRSVRDSGTDRNAYLLTEEGKTRDRTLRERLCDETVTLTNGMSEEVSLDNIDRYLDTPALVRALARLTPNGTVPLEEFHSDQLVGRRDELDQLLDSYDSIETRGGHAMLVTGEPGVGEPPRGQAPRLPISMTRLAETDEDRPPSVSTAVAVSTGVTLACPLPSC